MVVIQSKLWIESVHSGGLSRNILLFTLSFKSK